MRNTKNKNKKKVCLYFCLIFQKMATEIEHLLRLPRLKEYVSH